MMEQNDADRINAMSEREYKIFENRLRRMASRQGLVISKSRARDTRATEYGGYMIIDPDRNYVVAGGTPNAFSMDIVDVERFLTDDERPGFRKDKDGVLRWRLRVAATSEMSAPMSKYGEPAYDPKMVKPAESPESEADLANKYRLAQAEELLARFQDARGRPPRSIEELSLWAASRPNAERPIKPRCPP